MTTAQVNYLNIVFMVLSCIIAFVLPFELFLFSYAVLGPLHYLTEMSWLHKKQFFTPGKYDYLLLAVLAVVILFPTVFEHVHDFFGKKDASGHVPYSDSTWLFLRRSDVLGRTAIFVSFAIAAIVVLIKDTRKRVAAAVMVVAFALLFRSGLFVAVLFALFVPTLVHVFIFTGVFMLNGAIKTRSISGYLSIAVFIGCAAALLLLHYYPSGTPGRYALKNYDAGFAGLNRQIFDIFLHKQATFNDVFYSHTGVIITRFIAYAYTYHYLNWFSKTTVIRWHLVPRRSLILIVLLWVLSLLLYYTNYTTGIEALYFLSMLHVIFEFPLNVQSFREVGQAIWRRVI
jgi:hypothetical protein